jgi:hypothetical protein
MNNKVDVTNGHYQVWVRTPNIPKLGIVLPDLTNLGKLLIVLPMALPMGWVELTPLVLCTSFQNHRRLGK